MFNPKYRILITKKCFVGDKFICLGKQLASIVSSIEKYLPQHIWYGADVDAIGRGERIYNLDSIQPSLIGNDFQFIDYCSEIDQFTWGVFLCFDVNFIAQRFQDVEIETEDPSFRSINAQGILMEIRAFDTNYFAIYSDAKELITEISIFYHVDVETC